MNFYIYFGGVIFVEVIGIILMKFLEGFIWLWLFVGIIICYCVLFWLLV